MASSCMKCGRRLDQACPYNKCLDCGQTLPDVGGLSSMTTVYMQGPGDHASNPPIVGPRPQATLSLADFLVVEKLGSGGMGTVYLATQQGQTRQVALKMLSRQWSMNRNLMERFYREANVLHQLQHPNIVRFFGFGEEAGIPYFAMEYVDGITAANLLERCPRLEIADALYIVLRCADALLYAHARKICHRDIKPDNIMIARDGVVKLTDFGLAKSVDDDLDLTDSGLLVGTPKYVAPEQYVNVKKSDHRADIFSLGAVLYRFLAGVVPFQGKTPGEIQRAKEESKPAPLNRLNPEVPAKLEMVVAKMLMSDRNARYQGCERVVDELQSLGLHGNRLNQHLLCGDEGSVEIIGAA